MRSVAHLRRRNELLQQRVQDLAQNRARFDSNVSYEHELVQADTELYAQADITVIGLDDLDHSETLPPIHVASGEASAPVKKEEESRQSVVPKVSMRSDGHTLAMPTLARRGSRQRSKDKSLIDRGLVMPLRDTWK